MSIKMAACLKTDQVARGAVRKPKLRFESSHEICGQTVSV